MSSLSGFENVVVGATLGVWKLVKEIGQGGMGQVFLAQRADGHFEQTAAVKLLHGLPSAAALAYLARERQILATLTHPNIARLYDGGATPAGQPYLVMEYIEGVSIDRFATEQALSQSEILKLLTDICGALSFAHQRLIVHCDIKPSNILVTVNGRPMLLDFGIARLLDADEATPLNPSLAIQSTQSAQSTKSTESTERKPASTQTRARAFTPKYASPEQQAGHTLTTSTDVFSLGKMLEELLINALKKPKFRASSGMSGEPILAPELRAIVARATNVDVAKRYTTANALASDIARFQTRRPLAAIPASTSYVAYKFSQRNWPWLAVAGVAAVGVLAASFSIKTERDRAQAAELVAIAERDSTKLAQAATLRERDGAQQARLSAERERDRTALAEAAAALQRDRAKQSEAVALSERNRAVQAEAAAKQTSQFLISVFENAGPTAATADVTAATLLDRAEKQLEADLKNQPEVKARLYSTLGTVQRGMGAYLKAERLHAQAVGLEKQNALSSLAPQVALGASDVTASAAAGAVATAATSTVTSAPARPSSDKIRRAALDLADKLFTQANDLYVNAKGAQALAPAREALALREKHAAPQAPELGESLSQVGHMLVFARKLDEGKPLLERGLAIVEKVDAQSVATAYALGNLSWQRFKAGDLVAAEALSRRALALRKPK